MSYFFSIINTRDKPVFEIEFGTCKQGGDGQARFPAEARDMNRFIVHASLDFVDEMQWSSNQMYLKRVDSFASAQISAFVTPCSTRFMLLHLPHPPNTAPINNVNASPHAFAPFMPYTSMPASVRGGSTGMTSGLSQSTSHPGIGLGLSNSISTNSISSAATSTSGTSTGIPANPTSPQTEEAIRQFFGEVFEIWLKAILSPFQSIEGRLNGPIFRQRVIVAGKKYL